MKPMQIVRYSFTCLLFVILAGFGVFFMDDVVINYDLTEYLPEDSKTKQGLEILEKEFGNHAAIQVMIEDVTIAEAMLLKEKIKAIEDVKSVVWLDDAADITHPETISPLLYGKFYQNEDVLITVTFSEDSYSLKTEKAITKIRNELADYRISLRGETLANIENRNIAQKEIKKIMTIIIPIIIAILFLASKTWIEPVLILMVLGSAIAMNLGTNALLPNVSYITSTMVMALQLAVSLDFSLFLIHRYYEEREQGADVKQAVRLATRRAFASITGSAMTTILGFLALVFMSFSIGRDIGVVLAKGVLLSYLAVLLFMPPLIALTSPLLEKTRHRSLSLRLGGLAKGLAKMRFVIPVLFVIIAGFSYFGEKKALFMYGPQAVCDENSQVTKENQNISAQYGPFQPVVILVANGTIGEEQKLAADLMTNSHILAVESLITAVDPSIPREFIPEEIKANFIGEHYTRFIVYTDIETENEAMYQLADFLSQMVSVTYDDYYLVGSAVSTAEIKTTVTEDSLVVSLFSMIAVALVIMLIFRSLLIPLLLVAVIETSIWINMSIVFLQGLEITYIGYLVILALQLGATIDYAVLLSSRYLEFRKTENQKEAMKFALDKSGYSILISGTVLAIAGFSEGLFSEIQEIHDIGILIGRGAVLSAFLVILVLPSILLLCDKLIMKTTWMKRKVGTEKS